MSLTKDDLNQIKQVMQKVVKADFKYLRNGLGYLRTSLRYLKTDFKDLKREVIEIGDDTDAIYNDLQNAKSAIIRQNENLAAFVISANSQHRELIEEIGHYAQTSATKDEVIKIDARVGKLELARS